MTSSYRDLKVWQKSVNLAEGIYRLTTTFPVSEIYGLTSQMRRAGVSIASNIAEGWGRRSRKEYSRFVQMAQESNDELQTQLDIAGRLGFCNTDQLKEADAQCNEIGKMLTGLYRFLQTPRCKSLEPSTLQPAPISRWR
jgi:four helix bundle protein